MENLSQATREIMWNIGNAWLMYALFIAAMAIFCWGAYRYIKVWLMGQPDKKRFDSLWQRFLLMLREVFLQSRIFDSAFPGIFHSFIYYSFIVLTITTAVVALDYDFGTSLFNGYLYVLLTVAAELAGVFILFGVLMAFYRRYILKPETIETTFADTLPLLLIGLIVVTGFLAEGLRIAAIGDKWEWLSPVGLAVSYIFRGVSTETNQVIHVALWWSHTVLALAWIASIPFTKFVHIFSVPANIFFSKLEPRGQLNRVDIEAMMESEDFDEESFNVGARRTSDFTWKQLLDFDSCISCGRCDEVCPATLAKQPFSPKLLIQSLKDFAHRRNEAFSGEPLKSVGADALEATPDVVGNAFDEEFIWLCRTCTACMEVCPARIEHMDTIIDLRRNEVIMQGRMPDDAARSLKMLEKMGNPFGPQDERVDWIEELGIKIVNPGEECDVIYWIGCCTTFDPAKHKIATDLCNLLQKCGIDFGVLGADEHCCGDPARILGQEYLFQSIAKEQVEELNKRKFKVLLTSCPHCYNVLKNEFPQFGGNYNVVHHSEFLHEMLWNGELYPQFGDRSKIVYHDPCYLGRYQKIYDAPREVLKTIPGSEILEMSNYREKSLCCGAGGGHYWMDIKKGDRINNLRVQQAKDAGADTIVTSCAYCMQMLTDSVKIMDSEEEIRVLDIATLVLDSLEND